MSQPEYGETWVYEGIVGAVPGIDLTQRVALVLQFLLFESAVLLLGWYYNRWSAVVAGTVAVIVTTVGSAQMVRIARRIRGERIPVSYRKFLFASNIEVVLTVFAFSALITYLFAFDRSLIESLLGTDQPAPAVYLFLIIIWDVCYRIGAAWWSSVAGLWRSVQHRFDGETRQNLRRADMETAAFGLVQLAFVPFLLDEPLLLGLLVGHVCAVLIVTALAIVLCRPPERHPTASL
ncbi:hypothetical protein ACFQJ7_00940 [Halovenus rubra]|uniref:Uncharacterized protein n=2 Tax=Halovenus rubra TaxID=869890 RepID=A0ACC7E0D9_9EURY